MPFRSFASEMLAQEARALITRLARVRPFALVEPMLMAALPLPVRPNGDRHVPDSQPESIAPAD